MLWAALLLPGDPAAAPAPIDGARQTLATWALQFTPRVAIVDAAVVMEVEASVRLFGGRRALRDRVAAEGRELGVAALAWAPTSLAATALARAGRENGISRPLAELLDGLPLATLSAAAAHAPTLALLGCRTLGELRRLPRGGVVRRFDAALLVALDQAYGLRPEAHAWVALPEHFEARLELPARVELAPALLFGARRLLLAMCGWLAARHAGAAGFTLRWMHDAMRPREAGSGGELTVRTGAPMRDIEHFSRLLAEHLAHVALAAPVGDLALQALDVVPLAEASASLLPDPHADGEALALVLERLAARLGPRRVCRPVLVDDHRLEWAQHWQPAPARLPKPPAAPAGQPQPTFLLAEPLPLAVRDHRPLFQGPLQLLAGPHRVEGGWWHRLERDGAQTSATVARDYWVALSAHAGVLWVFQRRVAAGNDNEPMWFLHGSFA